MNTRKQVLIMSALLMLMLVAVALYAAWYPSRATDAEEHFEEARAERGAILFARNCRTCHGDVGEGGALGGRLPSAPALDRPDLQGFEATDASLAAEVNLTATTLEVAADEDTTVADELAAGDLILIDEERMLVTGVDGTSVTVERAQGHTEASGHFPEATIWAFDETVLAETLDLITNTISCGRVGTAMPPWAQDQGGPLSDEQIQQLAVLITTGRWDLVEHEVDIEDAVASRLTAPVPAEGEPRDVEGTQITVSEIMVSDVTRFTVDDAIRLGEERLIVLEISEFPEGAVGVPGTLVVQRGALGTFPQEHSQETPIYRFPSPGGPGESINEASCGQIARAPAPQGTPELVEPFDGQTVDVVALNIAFDTDEIAVESDGEVRVRLDNQDATVPHNIAFYVSETDLTPVSEGSVGITFPGPDVDDTVFEIPETGEYFFRCDVHPTQMIGTFVVN